MSTVHFWGCPREWQRPVIVEEQELFSSPAVQYEGPGLRHRAQRPFDVAEALEQFPEPYRQPSLVTVLYDVHCPPQNLAAVKCPKVLILGDTHHGEKPIERAVRAALDQPWDLVVNQYTRQHCHFFTEAGVKNVAWIPCFTINPINLAPRPAAERRGIFFGGAFQCHPYRERVIGELRRRGYPVSCRRGTIAELAEQYNRAAVCLNISLNGDFNLRNFEVIAAGGVLATDTLSGDSGQAQIFEEAAPACRWKSLGGLIDILESQVISRIGGIAGRSHEWFWRGWEQDRTPLAQLRWSLAGGDTWEDDRTELPAGDVWARIAQYERLQELQRQHVADEPLPVTITDERERADARDLHRLDIRG